MADLWDDLLGCLDLHAEQSGGDVADEILVGRNQRLGYHRVFGGQLLAQFVRAAAHTVPGKAVKSLHVLFPRAGRPDEPIRYEVSRQHESTSFATLTIVARQARGVTAVATVSLHGAEDGPQQQAVAPVPPLLCAQHQREIELLPWETRSSTDLGSAAAGPPEFEIWMRTPAVDDRLGPAITAYATDLTLIGTALRARDGVSQNDAGAAFTSAVTSHTVWFHRPLRTDDWLLLRQHSPILAHGRCFGRGDVLTEGGSLVASYAQEALLRFSAA
jgi:acyl-CoA thioesterase II